MNIICQQLFDASCDYSSLYSGGTDFGNSDPSGVSVDVQFKLTGNINALLRDQLFKVHHDPSSATGPNQHEFQGASTAWTKLHKQMWNNGATNNGTSANSGITATFQYNTIAPDGDASGITTWNHAWGILIGYTLDPQDTNGALIKASSVEQSVGGTGFNSSLLNSIYSAFSNVSSGPIDIDTIDASSNFLDALMTHLYAVYGCDTNFKRISGDPSDDFVSIAFKEGDQLTFFIKSTPLNAPQGQIRYMRITLEQDGSEDALSSSNANASFSTTTFQTSIAQDSTTGDTFKVSTEGTWDTTVSSSEQNGFLVSAVGSSAKVFDLDGSSSSSNAKFDVYVEQGTVTINYTDLGDSSNNSTKVINSGINYNDLLGTSVKTEMVLTQTHSGDLECELSFKKTDGSYQHIVEKQTFSSVASKLTLLDGAWTNGDPDIWASLVSFTLMQFQILPPLVVEGSKHALKMSAGKYNAGAIDSDGFIWTWGAAPSYSDGSHTAGQQSGLEPVRVVSSGTVYDDTEYNSITIADVGGGSSFLAITKDGRLKSWGKNTQGQLGNGNTSDVTYPEFISSDFVSNGTTSTDSDRRWKMVSACGDTVLGLDINGKLFSWGKFDAASGLGDGLASPLSIPHQITHDADNNDISGETFKHISSDHEASAAIDSNGNLYTWGSNSYRMLGHGTMDVAVSRPTKVTGYLFEQVDVGRAQMHALTTNGDVIGWGKNLYGQMGTGSTSHNSPPVLMTEPAGMVDVAQVTSGNDVAYFIDANGDLWTMGWQAGASSNWGSQPNQLLPFKLETDDNGDPLPTFKSLHTIGNNYYVLALSTTGVMYRWGATWDGMVLSDGIDAGGWYRIEKPVKLPGTFDSKTWLLTGNEA